MPRNIPRKEHGEIAETDFHDQRPLIRIGAFAAGMKTTDVCTGDLLRKRFSFFPDENVLTAALRGSENGRPGRTCWRFSHEYPGGRKGTGNRFESPDMIGMGMGQHDEVQRADGLFFAEGEDGTGALLASRIDEHGMTAWKTQQGRVAVSHIQNVDTEFSPRFFRYAGGETQKHRQEACETSAEKPGEKNFLSEGCPLQGTTSIFSHGTGTEGRNRALILTSLPAPEVL